MDFAACVTMLSATPRGLLNFNRSRVRVIQCGCNVLFQSIQSTGNPQALTLLRIRFGQGTLRQSGRNREELGRIPQHLRGMFEDKGAYFLQSSFILDDICLVQCKDDLLAPGEDALEELSLAFGEGMIGGGGEQAPDRCAAQIHRSGAHDSG